MSAQCDSKQPTDLSSERIRYFMSLQNILEKESSQGYAALHSCCKQLQSNFQEKYPHIPCLTNPSVLQTFDIDKVSQCLLPTDCKHLTPLATTGDGNCLYRAVSILCCGRDSLHCELRVRTVCEMILNEDFYLQPSITSLLDVEFGGKHTPVLPATSAKFEEACTIHSSVTEKRDIATIVFQLECLSTPRNGEWSSMWHVHAIASVLNKTIFSVFPNASERIRSVYHKSILPRQGTPLKDMNTVPMIVMWTHTHNMVCGRGWSPNHFVPCYAIPDVILSELFPLTSKSHPPSVQSTKSIPKEVFELSPMDMHQSSTTSFKPASFSVLPQTVCGSLFLDSPKIHPSLDLVQLSNSVDETLSEPSPTDTIKSLCSPSKSTSSSALQETPSKSPFPVTSSATSLLIPLSTKVHMSYTQPTVSTTKLAQMLTTSSRKRAQRKSSGSSLMKFIHKRRKSDGSDLKVLFTSSESRCISDHAETPTSDSVGMTANIPRKVSELSPLDTDQISATISAPAFISPVPQLQASANSPVQGSPQSLPLDIPNVSTSVVTVTTNDMPTTSGTVTTSMIFNTISSIGHLKYHKNKVPSRKITEYMKSQPSTPDNSDEEYDAFSYFYDEHLQESHSPNLSSSDTCTSGVSDIEIQYYPHYSNSLPFPMASIEWYRKQYSLSVHNVAREEVRQQNIILLDEWSNMQFINRSRVSGTLQDNIASLKIEISSLQDGPKQAHLQAIVVVGEFIVHHGPVVKTQEVGQYYLKEKALSENKLSMEFYEIFCKRLNLAQVYMYHTAYLVANSENLPAIFKSISQTVNSNSHFLVKQDIGEHLKPFLPLTLKYMDSHRDKLVVKALLAELTNISFASRIQGIQSRKGTASAIKSFKSNLLHYQHIRTTSQVVRSDLTNVQQYKLTERIISRRKLQEIKTIAAGRGRKLKCEKFPELATALMYAFGEIDVREGGGLEAHPRLTNGTLYRSSESAMTMKRAKEILLSLAPEGFGISLSSCYNYTENFRAGSLQAKRHHVGKGINAQLSLRKPPRTGVEQIVVNLHWSTANVNLLLDSSQGLSRTLLISKDAKAIVPSDIAPVQRPGHSWKSRLEFPDHSWDQSRTNSVTPMTFLFLQTKVSPSTSLQNLNLHVSENTILHLTRTGQSVTLLNLSFYEPETTFRCLNEICYLLTLSELDPFFRDGSSGQLKKEFLFVVDNGPAEQPCSPLVKMCLARLLRFLKLDKICQVSFAEYHSKRNFVERVHAEENRVLSMHGPFRSNAVHQYATPGTKEHRENMEHMAEEVRKCLIQGSFGGSQLMCFRGVKEDNRVFSDEAELQSFLCLSEEGKSMFSPATYSPQKGHILDTLSYIWHVEREYEGSYIHDYNTLTNEPHSQRTAWMDKYTTALYSDSEIHYRRYELQPVPDYLRWLKTGECHYLPVEERAMLIGPWNDIPGVFLPSVIVELCLTVVQELTDVLLHQIALAAWLTPADVKAHHQKLLDQHKNQQIAEQERERWKVHPLYRSNNKAQLEIICRQLKIPATPSLPKFQLVKLIVEKKKEQPPPELRISSYTGDLSSLPTSMAQLSHLTLPKLRSILKHHNLPQIGTKDQLVIRVHLLRHNRSDAVTAREEGQLTDLINLIYQVIRKQKELKIINHVYRTRKYSSKGIGSNSVPIPSHITSEDDLSRLFDPILFLIKQQHEKRKENDDVSVFHHYRPGSVSDDDNKEKLTQVGSKVKVRWTTEEVKDSGWKPGWYRATVQSYDESSDMLIITYASEPNTPYEEELDELISQEKIRLIWSPT